MIRIWQDTLCYRVIGVVAWLLCIPLALLLQDQVILDSLISYQGNSVVCILISWSTGVNRSAVCCGRSGTVSDSN